jgi:beta-phosphoglucomutase
MAVRYPEARRLMPRSETMPAGVSGREGFLGAVFDVDGVLVDSPHERAWRDALQQLMDTGWSDLRDRARYSPDGFTSELYREHMSGKPTFSGARAALHHFGLPVDDERVDEYGRGKQRTMERLLEAEGVAAYPDALRFVRAVRGAGIPMAAASSSKNAANLLARIRLEPGLTLLDAFGVDVSGRDFPRGGKPHPEIFLTAARELGVAADRCLVVEDSVSGVQAGRAAGMAVIGLARADDAEALEEADLVVATLDEVDLAVLAEGRLGH